MRQLWTIADSLSGIPVADAVDLVVAVGSAQIRTCDPATAATSMGWRLLNPEMSRLDDLARRISATMDGHLAQPDRCVPGILAHILHP